MNTLGTPDETGPLRQKADPRPPASSNAIRYHLRDQTGGLDNFSANIPFGLDAIEAFERAVRKKKFRHEGKDVPIRACAIVVGGVRDVNARTAGIHGGEVVVEWSVERGIVGRSNWRELVRGLPRPNVIPTNRQLQSSDEGSSTASEINSSQN